jgi:hypothetical protein
MLGVPCDGLVGVAEQPTSASMQPAIATFAEIDFIINHSLVEL